jgi:uncharacterized membrane protein
MGPAVAQVIAFLLIPLISEGLCRRFRVLQVLSPVVLCYAIGIVLGNVKAFPLEEELSLNMAGAAVLLAIPLLLLSLDFKSWVRLAPKTVLSCVLCLASVVSVALLVGWLMNARVPDAANIAGMLVGVYTGGSANMAAIGTALKISPETFIMVHASDVLVCGVYLMFLMALGGRIFALFLPPFEAGAKDSASVLPEAWGTGLPGRDALPGLAVGVGVVGMAGGFGSLVAPQFRDIAAILGVTSLAIALSFIPRIRRLPKTFEAGNLIMLVFCVSIGSLADFSRLAASDPSIFAYTTAVVLGSIVAHLVLCRIFGIDRDTAIITSTAAIYSPAFVPAVAASLKNREIVISGIACGLVGFAAGTYLGLSVAGILRFLGGG